MIAINLKLDARDGDTNFHYHFARCLEAEPEWLIQVLCVSIRGTTPRLRGITYGSEVSGSHLHHIQRLLSVASGRCQTAVNQVDKLLG